VADGVLLNWCTPERVERARQEVADGASATGRDAQRVTIGVYVRACLGHDEAIALDVLRRATAQYAAMPHYRRQLEALGLGPEAAAAATAASPGDVPEDLVRRLCLVGEPAGALARLDALRDAGADLPLVYPVPALEPVSSIMGTLLALAPSPALER
jgi:alkanesulfonate monooxygenase SsuD/methylene tetrahydromethanopterin reductase-like flavin-dependent oxidoreductase (luciferase family)